MIHLILVPLLGLLTAVMRSWFVTRVGVAGLFSALRQRPWIRHAAPIEAP